MNFPGLEFDLMQSIIELNSRVEALEDLAAEYESERQQDAYEAEQEATEDKLITIIDEYSIKDGEKWHKTCMEIPEAEHEAPKVGKGLINYYIEELHALNSSTMGINDPKRLKIQFAIQSAINTLKAEIA